jgi:hypothetical protein
MLHQYYLRRVLAVVFVSISIVATSSCSHDDRPQLHAVRGTMTVQKKPAVKAVVVLRPVNPGLLKNLLPHAEVGPDGTFRIGTYGDGDGAPEGEYRVTITWPTTRTDPKTGDEISEDRLKGRYNDPTKGTRKVTIKVGNNELEPIQLD